MFPAIFNTIIFDENLDLASCINNEFISAALTAGELTVIVPLIRSLVECDSIDQVLLVAGYTASTLMSDLKISQKTIEVWQERGFSEYEKYSLIFLKILLPKYLSLTDPTQLDKLGLSIFNPPQ